jgi:hypothetical protein
MVCATTATPSATAMLHHVGQIKLALGVVVVQPRQPGFEQRAPELP